MNCRNIVQTVELLEQISHLFLHSETNKENSVLHLNQSHHLHHLTLLTVKLFNYILSLVENFVNIEISYKTCTLTALDSCGLCSSYTKFFESNLVQ